jgi:hypothetical protein
MSTETSQKVTASQLKRSAFVYVRQSTPRQVLVHAESFLDCFHPLVLSQGSQPLRDCLEL